MAYQRQQFDSAYAQSNANYAVHGDLHQRPVPGSESFASQSRAYPERVLTQDELNFPAHAHAYVPHLYAHVEPYVPLASGSGLQSAHAYSVPQAQALPQPQPQPQPQWWPQEEQQWNEQIYSHHQNYEYIQPQQPQYSQPLPVSFSTADVGYAPSPSHADLTFQQLPTTQQILHRPYLSHNPSRSSIHSAYVPTAVPLQETSPARYSDQSLSPPPEGILPTLQAAAVARRVTREQQPGLPQVKPARESADPSPSATASAHRLNTSKPRTTLELSVSCRVCAQRGVKVILRGDAIRRQDFVPKSAFSCAACLAANESDDHSSSSSSLAGRARAGWPTYHQTMSAAVDKLEGLSLATAEEEEDVDIEAFPFPKLGLDKFKCDCCMIVVGAGKVTDSLADSTKPDSSFTTEIVCTRCLSKYKCCSDCGGGGGRLTIGRWRCVELFPMGRKTCRLSHARNPRINDLQWTVQKIQDIHPADYDYIVDGCRAFYFNARLQTTARPEVLEHGTALCRTFAEAEKLTIDGWNLLLPLTKQVVEDSRHIRRYLTIQTSIPSSRRQKSKAKNTVGSDEHPVIHGFIIVEWDMTNGIVHFPAALPWGLTGDAYDALSRSGTESIARVRADLHDENAARIAAGVELLPELKCVWLLSPFSKDSRAFVSLQGRGYVGVEDLRKDRAWADWEQTCALTGGAFPPERECHVPSQFVKTFQIAVRVFEGPDDLGAPPANRRRPRKGAKTPLDSSPAPPSRRK